MLFRDAVRSRRRELGLSQAKLGKSVGCTATHICSLEAGKRGPSEELIARLEGKLGYPSGKLDRLWKIEETSPSRTVAIEDIPLRTVPVFDKLEDRVSPPFDMSRMIQEGRFEILWDVVEASEESFGVITGNTSLYPEIQPGDLIVIDPKRSPTHGENVVVKYKESYQLRQYHKQGRVRMVIAIYPEILIDPIKVKEMDRIEGVIISVRRLNRCALRRTGKDI